MVNHFWWDAARGVQEMLVLMQDGNRTVIMILFTNKLAIARINKAVESSLPQTIDATPPSQDFFDEWFAQTLKPIEVVDKQLAGSEGIPGSVLTRVFPNFFGGVRGLCFTNLKKVCTSSNELSEAVPSAVEKVECPLILAENDGTIHILPFDFAPAREEVREAIADGLRSAIIHPSRKAKWSKLHALLSAAPSGRNCTDALGPEVSMQL